MWSTLKRIAQAELGDNPNPNQAADLVTLRFLSLAPRIACLNKAVRIGLTASGSAGAAGSTAGHAQR